MFSDIEQQQRTINQRNYRELTSIDQQYADLDLRFYTHPISQDLIALKEEEAIKNALKNLILTEPGEKPFNPSYGVPFNSMLFNLIQFNPFDFERIVKAAINRNEKRVKVNDIKLIEYPEQNAVLLVIIFTIKKLKTQHTLEINLKRTK